MDLLKYVAYFGNVSQFGNNINAFYGLSKKDKVKRLLIGFHPIYDAKNITTCAAIGDIG